MVEKKSRILPESEGPVLALEINEPVTFEIYNNFYLPALRDLFTRYNEVRVLYFYPAPDTFPGWEMEAADLDLKMKTEYGHFAKKVALVNAPPSAVQRWTLVKPLIGGEVKIYKKEELQDALAWVKA